MYIVHTRTSSSGQILSFKKFCTYKRCTEDLYICQSMRIHYCVCLSSSLSSFFFSLHPYTTQILSLVFIFHSFMPMLSSPTLNISSILSLPVLITLSFISHIFIFSNFSLPFSLDPLEDMTHGHNQRPFLSLLLQNLNLVAQCVKGLLPR
jgi:hypothetical protein